MIIYNSNKEFVGIDESDLKSLGFHNLAALQSESADFADLFVKTPGHVHNFKHVHWIDFVLCAKSAQESKAIIHANGKNFKTFLEIKTIYLSDSPSTQAYSVNLNHLSNLSLDEKTEIAGELQSRVAPVAAVEMPIEEQRTPVAPIQTNVVSNDSPIDIDEPIDIVDDPYAAIEDDVIDIYEPSEEELSSVGEAEVEEIYEEILADTLTDNEVAISIEEDIEIPTEDDPKIATEEVVGEDEDISFDPQKTAEALEMPISLIEEFIEDFVSQAKEFKTALYDAVAQDDMIELQSYSHKLKGVAANLRVNDALEILTKINIAKDFTTSKKDLDKFYRIISKLSGEKIENDPAPIVNEKPTSIEEDEPATIDLSDNTIDDDDELLEIVEDDFDALEIQEIENDPIEINMDDDDDMELTISDDFDILDEAMNEIIEQNDIEEENNADTSTKETLIEYDKESAALEIGIDKDMFNELFNDYINESQNLIATIEDAILNNIPEVWTESSIKLKGMNDNMRIDNFKTDLEVLITTKNADDAKDALTKIQKTIFELIEKKD